MRPMENKGYGDSRVFRYWNIPLTTAKHGWAKTIVNGLISTTLTGLKPDTDYWFKVRSYVQLPDGTRYYGQQSEAVHTKTLK